MKFRLTAIASAVLLLWGISARAQSLYDPHRAFDPLFDGGSKDAVRSSDGSPGPGYWQNRADYAIDARLDDSAKIISAAVRITYTNNSPDPLSYVWLALDQNNFAPNSRSARLSSGTPRFKGGFNIERLEVGQKGKLIPGTYVIDDTRMQVRLPDPVPPHGGTVTLKISYSYTIPPSGMGRTGWLETKNGTIYDIAQWYPRLEVYDDIRGWNVLPFLGAGEFYLEYGNFDYRVTVPADQLVTGSGTLLNPAEVLTGTDRRRLAEAGKSDATVHIRGLSDIPAPVGDRRKMKTWHFRMDNSRDVVWASSRAFLWDAAKINLPGGKRALAAAVYPAESATDSGWNRAAQYVKQTIEIFSRDWFPYPYPEAVAVGGPVGGMEYPGAIFGHWKATGKTLWMVINHEMGHEWFPMIVGSNERTHAWMDEGFNTFIDIYATGEFNKGEFAPKRDNEYAPKGGNPAREIVPFITGPASEPMISYADALPGSAVHPLEYFKPAFGLVLLREDILGRERFDYAFRRYIRDWAFRHPMPADFFRSMNNGAGESLDWFWKGWYIENWKLDQAVGSVDYDGGDTAKGALITIVNKNQMVMPLEVSVGQANGKTDTLRFPVEIWERSGEFTIRYPSMTRITSVVIDPRQRFPDIDTTNNVWTAPAK